MHVYTNSSASGSCEWMGSWAEHRVQVQCDADAAASIVSHLKTAGCSVAGLCAFSGYDAPLRWGEAVPLSFLRATTRTAKVIVLSHGPSGTGARCEIAAQRLSANANIGEALGAWAAVRESRVFLLISGDLAHSHGNDRAPTLADGTADPRYLNPRYPTADPAAVAFEACIVEWIRNFGADAGRDALFNRALKLLPRALCCGFEGFVMLDAALQHTCAASAGVRAQLLCHQVPVYYGMLIATFLVPGGDGSLSEASSTAAPPAKRPKGDASAAAEGAAASPTQTSSPSSRHRLLLPTLPPRLAALDFTGQSVLVSGAGHGFGRAIALAFAGLGATVSACDGPDSAAEAEAAETASLAAGLRGRVVASRVDFRDMGAVQRWVASHSATIDVLVLNAGGVLGTKGSSVEEASIDAWDAICDVNAKAAFVAAQAAAPSLKRSARGRIVTISSGAGLRPSLTGIHAYCAAKHALVGLTKQLALELGASGVTVNSVAPGFVRSNPASEAQWQSYGADGQAALVKGIFTRRLGSVDDIADAVLFFASEAAGWVTGQVLPVDGGRA